jgi:hypothetical protein
MSRYTPTVFLFLALVAGEGFPADTVPAGVQQPGTQPLEISNLESPDKCDNCHGGYNSAVEPAHNWRGSMMAHAGRDPIFWATMAVAEQDFDGVGDLCLRCHSTGGWLAGRSTPTDGSGLAAGDSDGVECDYCHKLTNPDDEEHQGVMNPPFVANDAIDGWYGSGMSSMWGGSDKLGPYIDADARHQFMQSKFHRDVDFCGTCHDVSNPLVGDLAGNHGQLFSREPVIASGNPNPNSPVGPKAAFNNPPYRYGVVERTFSEYKSGALSRTLVDNYPTLPEELQGGALEAIYQATFDPNRGTANYEDGAPRFYSCQSCHMRAVTGTGANKRGVPLRSDLPLHDMTGGNYWMPEVIDYLDRQGKLRLGGGMSPAVVQAMYDGALRAREQLQLAATLEVDQHEVKIINHTGHKLISGYPEGRRMWLNIKWFASDGSPLREDGAYGLISVTDPRNAGSTMQVETIKNLHDSNTRIYEAHMGMTREWAAQLIDLGYDPGLALSYDRATGAVKLTLGQLANSAPATAQETFHFALNNVVIKDNRIPPYGMSYDEAERRNASPVPQDQFEGQPGGVYEYYDEVPLNQPSGAAEASIDLLYQPTSWEYIQFLYLANDGSSTFLGNEGVNMLDAWLNTPTKMARPVVMASATWRGEGQTCSLGAPTLISAWGYHMAFGVDCPAPERGAPDDHILYYDQAGKSQLVTSLDCSAGNCLSYTDTGLTNGQTYCYKVTASNPECESGFSNILCATPQAPGQTQYASVAIYETGRWITEGKARNRYPVYQASTVFAAGDEITFKIKVTDESGIGIGGSQASIAITGPEPVNLQASASDGQGLAEVRWTTTRPNKKGVGGTAPGSYTATITGLSSSEYQWDGTASTVNFSLVLP